MPKFKTLKQQKRDGELGLIIDEFGRAMWNANRHYVTGRFGHAYPCFTPNMEAAWAKYVEFCRNNLE